MADYILSNNNRYYAALESEYGVAPTITASHRVPGVRLAIATQKVTAKRRDKTGTRTFLGTPGTPRKVTGYEFETSLMAQDMGTLPPAVGQMVQAALGGAAQHTPAQSVAVSGGGIQVDFLAPHGLNEGSAVNVNGELRFVESVPSPMSVRVCAPFTKTSGATVAFPAVAYAPAKSLPSVSLFDYWDPNATVQRVVRGAGVDEMEIQLDGTEHRIVFRGPAAQHVDSVSFQSATGALTTFPLEPAVEADTSAPVPGHLGQVWLGNSQTQVLTLTKAQIRVKNNLQARSFRVWIGVSVSAISGRARSGGAVRGVQHGPEYLRRVISGSSNGDTHPADHPTWKPTWSNGGDSCEIIRASSTAFRRWRNEVVVELREFESTGDRR